MSILLLIASIIIEIVCGIFIGWHLHWMLVPHGTFNVEPYEDDGTPMAKIHIAWPISSDPSTTKTIVLTREEH